MDNEGDELAEVAGLEVGVVRGEALSVEPPPPPPPSPPLTNPRDEVGREVKVNPPPLLVGGPLEGVERRELLGSKRVVEGEDDSEFAREGESEMEGVREEEEEGRGERVKEGDAEPLVEEEPPCKEDVKEGVVVSITPPPGGEGVRGEVPEPPPLGATSVRVGTQGEGVSNLGVGVEV